MKITKLRLKNFAHIYSGLNKREVLLEFTGDNNKLINIIIGKMGSCKTIILGHLQPFASLGTLDIRNQDDVIIPGEDGLKNIVFVSDGVVYDITHTYTWNEKTQSHSVKSYITRNGEDLNPNGNVRSFAAVIKEEFGIEQSLLRLFRLGSNVTSIIDLRGTERKTFVSSLMPDTDIYEMLYKKLRDDSKKLNAQISILTNRANSLSTEPLDTLKDRLSDLEDTIAGLEYRADEYKKDVYVIEAESKAILSGYDDLDSYVSKYEALDAVIKKETKRYREVEKAFKATIDLPTEAEVAKSVGITEGKIQSINERINTLTDEHEKINGEITVLEDKKKTFASDTQIKMMQANYDKAVATYNEYKQHASLLETDVTSNQMKTLLSDINTFSSKISELRANNLSLLNTVAYSDGTILLSAKGEISKLSKQKLKLQRELNNIEFSASYHCTDFLVIPPKCPAGKNCPFVSTHPFTLGLTSDNTAIANRRKKINDEISIIDGKIDELETYPVIYSQLATIKKLWNEIYPIMQRLGVLLIFDFAVVVTTGRDWYNTRLLSDINESVEKKEKLSSMSDNIIRMRNILQENSMVQIDEVNSKLDSLLNRREELIDTIMELNQTKKNLHGELDKLAILHTQVLERDRLKNEMDELLSSNTNNTAEFERLSTNIDTIYDNKKLVDSIKPKLNNTLAELSHANNQRDKLKILINDVVNTTAELDELVVEQMFLKHIISAVSPSEGIPLIYVERFLDSCREIMNDLISDVFADQIVIQKFVINEDEFRIPYTMNGTLISDISYCSQGQKSIISLALAFAMIRQAIEGSDSSFVYNIIGLDEVDGALYKSSRNDFINVLFKQLKAIHAEQAFLISHNNTFDGFNVNIIMTTEEIVDESPMISVMRV